VGGWGDAQMSDRFAEARELLHSLVMLEKVASRRHQRLSSVLTSLIAESALTGDELAIRLGVPVESLLVLMRNDPGPEGHTTSRGLRESARRRREARTVPAPDGETTP
jgi:hypothetical protein